MQLGWGYAAPLIMEAAVRHGIFDLLDQGPRTLEEIAGDTGASRRGLRAILNALVGLQLLSKDGGGRYALTPESSAFLVSSRPGYIGGMLRHASRDLIPRWLSLTETVHTGTNDLAAGHQKSSAEFFHDFVADIMPMSVAPAKALAEALRVADAAAPLSVLDVAAGSGVWSIMLAKRSPQVRVTAVDWPGVLEVTREMAERFGVADRYTYIGGDLATADFGRGHHIATLGHILHALGETGSRALLQKTYDSLGPGGTIAIQEFLVNDDRTGPPMALIFAVNMLVGTEEGDTFSFQEIAGWLREAGFENARTLDAPGPSPIILANRPA
jgi:ubiquinone/menaquinone biosynthesis C-methylase UbiE